MNKQAPVPLVHLVGSIPGESAEESFRTAIVNLPTRIRRIPDGEVGERGVFVRWQANKFPEEVRHFRFLGEIPEPADGIQLKLEHIQPTGYDAAALESYAVFCELRNNGTIPVCVRFQVSLPTPINATECLVHRKYSAQVYPLYETRILEALANIQAKIPPEDLAIQWDMAVDMAHMEYAYGADSTPVQTLRPDYSPVKETIVERVTRLAAAVDSRVELGFHLCYGDFNHKHFIEPKDARLLTELINPLIASVQKYHPVEWVHLPVPKSRTDAEYYEPLRRLDIGSTLVYLGLIHANDLEGTEKRIKVAKEVLPSLKFAVSNECGLGRTLPEELNNVFEICRQVTVSDPET